MSDQQPVLLSRDGPLAMVTLNRPDSRNALNLAMCQALQTVFEELSADDSTRVVILEGKGEVFCAGADLKEREGKDENWVRDRRRMAFAAYEKIAGCSKPVIAAIGGAVVGSGGEIAMSCDFIVASDNVTFRFPEPQWGTVGATQQLQRVIGKRRAKELLFTGRAMPVSEAYTLGLVARVVPVGTLLQSCRDIAVQIAKAPALAMTLTKQAIDMGEETDLASGIKIELSAIDKCLADGSWRQGIERFSKSIGHRKSDNS